MVLWGPTSLQFDVALTLVVQAAGSRSRWTTMQSYKCFTYHTLDMEASLGTFFLSGLS